MACLYVQEQKDEVVALASILDQNFSLTAGPSTSGNLEDDVAALAAAEACIQQIQCTAAVHVVLPSGRILIKVLTACNASHCYCYSLAASAAAHLAGLSTCLHSTHAVLYRHCLPH